MDTAVLQKDFKVKHVGIREVRERMKAFKQQNIINISKREKKR